MTGGKRCYARSQVLEHALSKVGCQSDISNAVPGNLAFVIFAIFQDVGAVRIAVWTTVGVALRLPVLRPR